MQHKRGNATIVLTILLLLVFLSILFLVLLYLFPILNNGPPFVNSARNGVEKAANGIEEAIGTFKGERVKELRPEELPFGVNPGRVLYNIENETLTLMNKERTDRGLQALTLDERIANVAFLHSREMDLNDYINHTNLEGEGPSERISDSEIFSLCTSENIFFIESREPRENLAEKAVQGWLDSPGHRRNLLDPNISKAGVGIHCQDRRCYVTVNHICTKTEINEELQDGFVYFFSLYPEQIEFNVPTKVLFSISLTKEADVYIIPDKEQYGKYVERESYQFTKQYADTTNIMDTAVIERGYGLMVVPTGDSSLEVDLDYA